jgi:hypothetical protein
MQSFWSQWPVLPLPPGGGQDTSEVAAAPAPVLEPLAASQSTFRSCPTCGGKLRTKDRRRVYCSDACKPKRNGHDPKPLADLTERPMRGQSYEAEWLAEQLKPPPMPWES